MVFGRQFVKRFALCYRSVVCPVLSACIVDALWPNGWMIKMKLGMQVGLVPSDIVLDGDSAPLPQRGTAPNFRPYLLWQKGCMDQDTTWYGGRLQPRRLCVRLGPRSTSTKRGGAPKFSARVHCGQTAGWIKMPLGTEVCQDDIVLDGDPAHRPPSPQRKAEPPIFSPCLLCAKRPYVSEYHVVRR